MKNHTDVLIFHTQICAENATNLDIAAGNLKSPAHSSNKKRSRNGDYYGITKIIKPNSQSNR